MLALTLIFNLATPASAMSVYAPRNVAHKVVFVDGVSYTIDIDEELNIVVSAKTLTSSGKMVLDKELNGTVVIQSNRKFAKSEYAVQINNLDAETSSLDVSMTDLKTNIVETMSYSDVIKDQYVGQSAIAVGGVITVGSLLAALLYSCLAIVIAGVTCYAVDAVISAVKSAQSYYYKAYRRLNTVFINPNPISKTQATNRIRSGADTYTYTSWRAKDIVVNTGLGVTNSENHWAWYKIGSFFNHYHTANRNGAHSFYGLPK